MKHHGHRENYPSVQQYQPQIHASIQLLKQFHWKCLVHMPYSPNLAPSDFQHLGSLKKQFKEKHFQYEDNVMMKGGWHLQILTPDVFSTRNKQVVFF